ncbi:hypothetical protein [Micromonospora sp. U21]|uniref:hypothetical protein n=1 Tax=Micromonospora sp. U21 TaxID=2824899 RepID=UPI001B386CF7|nr:hypothetical protein [Micromonospora sp. U21]MBQ0904986.1 hypothetical protein [Micromonospora sp. U21]
MDLRGAAFRLAAELEGDVQIREPAALADLLRATTIALCKCTLELMDATAAAGEGSAVEALRKSLAGQDESARALAEAAQALSALPGADRRLGRARVRVGGDIDTRRCVRGRLGGHSGHNQRPWVNKAFHRRCLLLRCPGRLARWTLRGALLIGGVVGLWGFHEAVADDAARAAEPAASCTLGGLLSGGGTHIDSSLGCTPFSLNGPGMESVSGRVGGEKTVPSRGHLAGLDVPVRMPAGQRSAVVQSAVGQVGDPTVAADAEAAVEAVASATRPVVGLASPVVEKIAETGLLEPVGTVVGPVTQPIVDVLPPALAPVLDLTQPIIGLPAAPSMPPAGPAVDAPPSTDEAPTVATPIAIVRPLPPMAAVHPVAPQAARTSVSAGVDPRSPNAAGTGQVQTSQVQWAGDMVQALGLTRGAPASAGGQGSGAGGTGIPADASLRVWAPALQLVDGYVTGCEKLAGRSGQPGTRPA